ncbi:hypothetical protein [Amycolatopsis magusensis]|uniref:Uncharacterized protein n=1 Tax=Amycolatopsis magusensis TaxID=882444 RepID=A0ABS4Q4Q5_9PSEU|nr:hypothetical protein [Amycolatopsis magusensis]MBP2186664.1 hypothetical protein [Amycolatopsis magusensis]MDI5976936.1 hypothetical protein [Amycolatopsis magusensis]
MADNDYLAFLLIGALMVLVDGQILYRNGRRYAANSDGGSPADATMARMTVMVFHLVGLGVLALLSIVDIGEPGDTTMFIGKLGFFLLLLAAAHAITIGTLARQRREREYQQRQDLPRQDVVRPEVLRTDGGVVVRPAEEQLQRPDTTVTPVPGQPGADPQVSPTLEQRGPYSA